MATDLPTPAGAFTRAKTGLVRPVGTRDVFFFGWQSAALSFIVFMVLAWGAYPGASMELASLLAMLGGVVIAACYGLVATLYPRSGAEYVFLSRTLHPAVGFALSFSFAFWLMFSLGIGGALACVFAVSPLLAGIAVQEHSAALLGLANWLAEPAGMFLGGSAVVALLGYLHYRGAGGYFRWQRWASYLSLVSLAATVVVLVLAATGVLDFRANFDRLAGPGSYQQVVAGGRAAGDVPFSLTATWHFALWPVIALWFTNMAAAFSGEVKDVRRGQLVGMVGSVIVAGIAFIVLTFLYRTVFGADFLLAAAHSGVPLGAPPQVPFFTAIAGGNLAVTVITGLWVVAITLFTAGVTLAYPSRTMLAWSLDGKAPRRLGDVNDRYHSPHWIILACVAVAETALALFAFTHVLGIISGYVGFMANFLVVCAWCVLFPFLRRETFENSPIAWRIHGVPVLTILAVLATASIVPIMDRLAQDTTFSVNPAVGVWASAIVITTGFGWFYGWRAYQRRRGIDLDRRYTQIPVE
jgi:amino acid transporter